MGLDTVELVMDVEEHFGVLLREERRWRILTIEDLADAVLDEIAIVSTKPSQAMRVFYEVRTKIRDSLSMPDCRIRPSTKLSELIPISQRRVCWDAIQSVQPGGFPGLLLSLRVRASLTLGVLICYLAPFLVLPLESWVLSVFLSSLLAILLGKWMGRYRLELPRSMVTVGDLVCNAVSVNKNIRTDIKTKEMVLAELFPIISEQFGVNIKSLNTQTRFIEDLGAG